MITPQSTPEASFITEDIQFHPKFNDESANIITSSNQSTLFRMRKLILQKNATPWTSFP